MSQLCKNCKALQELNSLNVKFFSILKTKSSIPEVVKLERFYLFLGSLISFKHADQPVQLLYLTWELKQCEYMGPLLMSKL